LPKLLHGRKELLSIENSKEKERRIHGFTCTPLWCF
jgi:hypothetical protein